MMKIKKHGNKGRKQSEDHTRKIRQANLGKKRSEETRKKLRESHLGYKMPDGQKRKIGKAHKKQWQEGKRKMHPNTINYVGR